MYHGFVSQKMFRCRSIKICFSDHAKDDDPIVRSGEHEISRRFENTDLVSAVVDKQGFLLGRITVDDVVDVIREEVDESVEYGG